MPEVNDKTTVTLDLKWVLLLAGMLLSAGGMGYQIKSLSDEVRELKTQTREIDRRTIEIGTTVTLLNRRTP